MLASVHVALISKDEEITQVLFHKIGPNKYWFPGGLVTDFDFSLEEAALRVLQEITTINLHTSVNLQYVGSEVLFKTEEMTSLFVQPVHKDLYRGREKDGLELKQFSLSLKSKEYLFHEHSGLYTMLRMWYMRNYKNVKWIS